MDVLKRLENIVGSITRRSPATQLATLNAVLVRGWSDAAFSELKGLALQGYAPAQVRLGQIFESAEGVVQSLPDSIHWYRLAAQQGHLTAQVRLGLMLFIEPPAFAGLDAGSDDRTADNKNDAFAAFFPNGTVLRQDFSEAYHWNHEAALQGSAEGQARLGHQLSLGLGVESDLKEAERWFAAAAQQGNADGQLGLGLLYAGQHGSSPDLELAATWLKRSASQGNFVAQYGVGKLLLHGEGLTRDVPSAMRCLEQSAAQNYAPAMYLLGMAYWQGTGQNVDLNRAETWLRRAVTRGHGDGACALAQMLMSRPGDDAVEAGILFREQAEAGDKRAAAALAELYTFGRGVPVDVKQAARWRAVSESDPGPSSLTMMASLHVEGITVPQNYSEAAALLLQASEKGGVDALYNLGWLYRLGKGVPRDLAKAESYWRKAQRAGSSEAGFQLGLLHTQSSSHLAFEAAAGAFAAAAEAGHVRARANLGLMVAEGIGVDRDPGQALTLLRQAAESNDPSASAALGFQLLGGLAGEPDLVEVRALLERAAEGGDGGAQAWMGDVYRLGLDGPLDYELAEVWYRRAAAQGHVGAIVLLASAIDAMTPSTLESELEAFGLWLAAASAGEPVAQFKVGQRYIRGHGCDQNADLGTQWLAKAAVQGYKPA